MRKILIIDDESLIRSSIARALRSEGYSVEEAKNGAEALERVKNTGCDLAVVDLYLEDGMHGMELIREIRLRNPGAKVIVVTALATDDIRDTLYREGIDGFFDKPFEIKELRNMVKHLLQGEGNAAEKSDA
ncbi:MAG: response regulator [Thermodesulfovibrionales bacterium]